MSDMKCPFCNSELKRDYYDCEMLECHNPKCKHYYHEFIGREELWQELIHTYNALEIAIEALSVILQITNQTDVYDTANNALNAITAPEQKDK